MVDYAFVVEEIGGPATLTINTTYSGLRADNQRDNILAGGTESIGLASLDYYSNAYPGIAELKPLSMIDENRDSDNTITLLEHYLIEDFWVISEADSSFQSVEISPLEMMEVADVPASAERTAPYATGSLLDLQVNITIMMPEDWPVSESDTHIHGDTFKYDSVLKGNGMKVNATYRYQRLQQFIPAEDTRSYIADHERIWEDLFLNLTYDTDLEDFTFSWLAGAIALVILILALMAARNIHRNFDPPAATADTSPLSIGGWLVLPSIGVVFRPFIELFSLLSDPIYFDHSNWISVLQNDNYSSFSGLGFVLGFELIYSIVFIVFSLLVFWQFFKKRSSFPRLMVFFLASELVITVLDMVLVYFLVENGKSLNADPESMQFLLSVLFSALIWIPYFLNSSRVKKTFINRYLPLAAPATTELLISENEGKEKTTTPALPPPSRWPGTMVFTAIIQVVIVMLSSVSMMMGKFLAPSDVPAGTPEAAGFLVGTIIGFILINGLPILGLFSIIRRRSWARKFNLVYFFFCLVGIVAIGISAYNEEAGPNSIINLWMIAAMGIPLLVTIHLLLFSKTAKNFPQVHSAGPSSEDDHWNYSTQCRNQAHSLFSTIEENFPHFKMTIKDSDPEQPINMVIPEQPGVPRCIFMDLQKTDVLNLSIGPIWMNWKDSNHESVRNDFRTTMQGLLNGTFKLVEYLHGDELRGARIMHLQKDGWVELCSWSKNHRLSTSGLEEVVVEFGLGEDQVPNED